MRRRGLTLAELTLTASLLAIVFLVILNLVPSAIYSGVESRHRLDAQALAGQLLDTCSARPFSKLQVGTYDPTSPGNLAGYLVDVTTSDQVVLQPRVDISLVTGVAADKLKKVKVTVVWRERNRQCRSVRVRQISCVRR